MLESERDAKKPDQPFFRADLRLTEGADCRCANKDRDLRGIDSGTFSNSPSTFRSQPLASRARKAYDFNIVDSYVIRFRSDDQVYRRFPFCETVEYAYKMSRLFFLAFEYVGEMYRF